jgi:preprotein translocase subunit SecG
MSSFLRHESSVATLWVMVSVLAVLQVLIVFVLVGLILMHSGRDAGMGGMGFTPASQGGTHIVERNLTRYTVVMAVLFFVNSIALFHYLK